MILGLISPKRNNKKMVLSGDEINVAVTYNFFRELREWVGMSTQKK